MRLGGRPVGVRFPNETAGGNKNDRIDARELADRLYMNKLSSVYHGGAGVRTLKELTRSYLTTSKDFARVMSRVKAIYRSWGIPCAGKQVYALRHRAEWLAKINGGGQMRRYNPPMLRAARQ